MTFWQQTSGTWINLLTVVLGSGVGLALRGNLSEPLRQVMTQALGLITLLLGLNMGLNLAKVQVWGLAGEIVGLMALVSGGLLGEWWGIESGLARLGNWLKRRCQGGGQFTEGFVAASLLFCVGPMALLGSLNNGLRGDATLLTIKATLDGIAAVAMTSSYGLGVGFSSLPILLYQGSLSLAAGGLAQVLPDPATHPAVVLSTGVGGLMIVGISLNLLEVAKVRVGSFLPALGLAVIFACWGR